MEDLYRAISVAETGGYKNPWRRTSVSTAGSSAYGPVQLTGGSGSMIQNVLNVPGLQKMFEQKELHYMSDMVTQAAKFLKYGNEPGEQGYDVAYDYSPTIASETIYPNRGLGYLGDEEHERELYKSVATKLIGYELGRAQNVGKFIDTWRGKTDNSGQIVRDTKYYDKVLDNLKSTVPSPTLEETKYQGDINNKVFDFMVEKTEGVNLGEE